jgi:hypothetical protein
MTITPRIRILVVAAAALLCAAALWPAAGHAAGRHLTIKAFSKVTSVTLTAPDGTVVDREPQPGDTLDVFALDFRGNHKHHAKRYFASEHLQCVFGSGEPDCVSHVAMRNSLMVWDGSKLLAGTGRFAGATGRIVSNQEVPGGSDIVAKVKLAKRR